MKKSILIKFVLIAFSIAVFFSCSKSGDNTGPKNTGPSATINALSIDSGGYNTAVIITGTGFSQLIANDKVYFNGKPATVTAASSTQLSVNVPLAAGTGNVTLSVNSGQIVSGPVFIYQRTEVVTTLAGSGMSGNTDGTGLAATFDYPWGITIDQNGNLYVSDNYDGLIRKITQSGQVTTLAGGGSGQSSNGQGSVASFGFLTQLTMSPSGVIYAAANIPREVTLSGLVSSIPANGLNFDAFTGITFDATGNLYLSDATTNTILKIFPSGVVSTFAGSGSPESVDGTGTSASFNHPAGLVADAQGDIYVADESSGLIRKITPAGVVTTFAGAGTNGSANGPVNSFNIPTGLAIDAMGNIYVADTGNNLIKKITPSGVVTLVTSDGGYLSTTFHNPDGLVVDATGNIYVTDAGFNRIQKISFE